MNGREAIAQVLDHLGRTGDEAAAGGEALREGAHPQVDLVLEPEELAGAGAAGAEHADGVRLVDHQPGAVAPAELDDRRQVAEVALHREDAVDDHQHAAAVAGRALEHLLELRHLVVAEGAQLGARELAAVEDRGVVGGVADHRVAGAEDRADAADVGLVAGGEDDRLLGLHPLGELALELEVKRGGAVEQPRAGEPGAVGLERVAGGLLDPRVAGQAEVVVGAEHDRLAPLHLDHRARPRRSARGSRAAGRPRFADLEQLGAVVGARLLEHVDRGAGRLGSCVGSVG